MPDSIRPVSRKGDIHMREGFEDAVTDIINEFTPIGNTRVISWKQIETLTTNIVNYAQYHFRARGFYVKPSTPGTFPMRASRFLPLARKNIKTQIIKALSITGLEQRAESEVI